MRKLTQTMVATNSVHTSSSAKLLSSTALALFLTTATSHVLAGERESLEQLRDTTVNLVKLLVQEGVLSKDKAEALLKQAEKDAENAKQADATSSVQNKDAVDAAVEEKMVRVQYVPEIVKQEMKEEIKKDVMAKLNYKAGERLGIPEWIDRLHWEGDIRLRYEGDRFGGSNPNADDFNASNGTDLKNTTEDRDRARIRARLGVKADINDWMKAGVRITTGDLDNPVSPNQTQEVDNGKYTIGLDRAYVTAQIKPWFSITGGRFENPWFSTDLVWDPDLAFDGVAASFTPEINNNLSSFVTIGVFPLDEIEESHLNKSKSKWMYGGQAGVKWTAPNKSSVKLGVALYEFDNVEGQSNGLLFAQGPYDATVPAYQTKGNSTFDINAGNGTAKYGLTSQFRELNITGEVDLAMFDPVHVVFTGDYAKNIGFDKSEIAKRTGLISALIPDEDTDAYQLKLAVGMPKTEKAHDWQGFVAYKYLGADSVIDGYTDSDFYLGGTNAKGWILGGSYGLDKNAWLTARWFSAEEISPRNNLDPLSIDVLMLDLNTKF
ncbi:MAG: putative porin [Methylophilus sp.]